MALQFERGSDQRPRGHAVLYFRSRGAAHLLATYLIVLPIKMDVGKYLPPFLAAQFGSIGPDALGGGVHAFAAPPMPERFDDAEALRHLAEHRDDDLVFAGDMPEGDLGRMMADTTKAVQEYAQAYERAMAAMPPPEPEPRGSGEAIADPVNVQRLMFELMSERDRMAELSKQVGMLRFSLERQDHGSVAEADTALEALADLLPEHYWVRRLRAAAGDLSDVGAKLAQLYVERCYKLMAQDFAAVAEIERRIKDVEGSRR
ncbi:MAG: hypothetical protein FJ318_09980 [SAR202 cluster bacterium]|nr:hypothetical protein [SAR202 cluster bacterium]